MKNVLAIFTRSRVPAAPCPSGEENQGNQRWFDGPPEDTLDPRVDECTEHHYACDCREGVRNELISELSLALTTIRSAANTVLEGHVTFDLESRDPAGYAAESPRVCPCEGCVICRLVYRQHCAPLRSMADQRPALAGAAT